MRKKIAVAVPALLFVTTCLASQPTKPTLPAPVIYRLTACIDSAHHNCRDVGQYPSSGACEVAKKDYIAKHPGEFAGCNKKP